MDNGESKWASWKNENFFLMGYHLKNDVTNFDKLFTFQKLWASSKKYI